MTVPAELLREALMPWPTVLSVQVEAPGRLVVSGAGMSRGENPQVWNELVGPFYDLDGLSSWLGSSTDDLETRGKARRLLMLRTGDDTRVFPVWQFTRDRRVAPHLNEVLDALAAGTDDPWTWALWLNAVSDDFGGRTSAQWLTDGGDPAPVLTEARRDAARWST